MVVTMGIRRVSRPLFIKCYLFLLWLLYIVSSESLLYFYILHPLNSLSVEHTTFVRSSSTLEHHSFLGLPISPLYLSFYSLIFFQFYIVLSLRTLV